MNDRPATSTLVDAPLQPRTRSSHATDAGQARYRQIRTAIDEITARLYGDLPTDDLATAGRVLSVQREEDSLQATEQWARQAHRSATWALRVSGIGLLLAAIALFTG